MTTSDKISQDAEHYRKGMLGSFGMSDTPGAGKRAKELYEAGMRKYRADPVEPIRRRFEILLKKLHKPKNWDADDYMNAKELCANIDLRLQMIVKEREELLAIAEKYSIKVKKGIVI